MLRGLYDLSRQIIFLARDMQQSKLEIGELQDEMKSVRQELRQLQEDVRMLALTLRHSMERERQEREKLTLALENQLLRFERRLGPGSGSTENQG